MVIGFRETRGYRRRFRNSSRCGGPRSEDVSGIGGSGYGLPVGKGQHIARSCPGCAFIHSYRIFFDGASGTGIYRYFRARIGRVYEGEAGPIVRGGIGVGKVDKRQPDNRAIVEIAPHNNRITGVGGILVIGISYGRRTSCRCAVGHSPIVECTKSACESVFSGYRRHARVGEFRSIGIGRAHFGVGIDFVAGIVCGVNTLIHPGVSQSNPQVAPHVFQEQFDAVRTACGSPIVRSGGVVQSRSNLRAVRRRAESEVGLAVEISDNCVAHIAIKIELVPVHRHRMSAFHGIIRCVGLGNVVSRISPGIGIFDTRHGSKEILRRIDCRVVNRHREVGVHRASEGVRGGFVSIGFGTAHVKRVSVGLHPNRRNHEHDIQIGGDGVAFDVFR